MLPHPQEEGTEEARPSGLAQRAAELGLGNRQVFDLETVLRAHRESYSGFELVFLGLMFSHVWTYHCILISVYKTHKCCYSCAIVYSLYQPPSLIQVIYYINKFRGCTKS